MPPSPPGAPNPAPLPHHRPPRARAAVPCLSRASELEVYDPQSEFALAGDDDGWTATHRDPQADAAAAEAGGGGGAGAAGDDAIPSIDDDEAAGEGPSWVVHG